MPGPVRLLHFSDLHIGMENYGRLDPESGTSTRVRDFLDRLDEVVEYALAHEADLVLFTGDAFKTRDPEPTQQREFARRIKRLAERIPTLLLVGNHDLPGSVQKATSVDIYRVLDVPNVIVGHLPEGRVVQTARGPVFLAWIPYPMRNRLLGEEDHRGLTLEQLDAALRTNLLEFLRALTDQARAQAMPRVLAGHFSISEARAGSEQTVMIGREVSLPRSEIADRTWDYVAMGHIHRHQNLTAGMEGVPPVVYAGSLERIDFGEEEEAKGFVWVELGREATRHEFIPVRARPFVTVRLDLSAENDPGQSAAQTLQPRAIELQGAVVRLILTLRSDQASAFDERPVQRLLSGATHLTIQKEIQATARMRLAGTRPESLSRRELLERYLQSKSVEPARIQELLALAEAIFDASG